MENILNIPSMNIFNNDWDLLLMFMENEGNPPFHIGGDVDLDSHYGIKSLGNLVSVGGYLNMQNSSLQSLGKLKSVGNFLNLNGTHIKSLGKLKYVGSHLYLMDTEQFIITEDEIRNKVNVKGHIYGKYFF